MSGILCVYNEAGIRQDRSLYLSTLRRLTHRGPRGHGSILREDLFLGVECSDTNQPWTKDGASAAFDGRIHNREELESVLQFRGCRDDLSSDAALILSLYLEYGEEFTHRLRGVWALVIHDTRRSRLLLSRDPVGIRPLYYYHSPEHLVVASEIKSILPLDDRAREVDHERIHALVDRGSIDDWTATCFAHVRPAPPGCNLGFHRGTFSRSRYWVLHPRLDPTLDAGTIRDKLIAAVERHTPHDVKVGLSLSGGIDSSSIAGILTRPRARPNGTIHAFSITPPQTPDESFLIDTTIRHTGLPHTYVPLDGLDYPREIGRFIDAHDEPIHYSGAFYQFVLRERMAESGCRAVLVGYGADEIFAGYRALAPAFLIALALDGRFGAARRFVSGAREFLGLSSAGIVGASLGYARLRARTALIGALKRTTAYRLYRQRTGDRARSSAGPDVFAAPEEIRGPDVPIDPLEPDLKDVERGRFFFTELLRSFRTNFSLLVRQEDRNAMAHGLDLCAPFMDEDLVRAAVAFPFHRYMEEGRNKAILRDATLDFLASSVSSYPKKLVTPGSDPYVAFEALGQEFEDLLRSRSFQENGLWSRRCPELYRADRQRKARGHLWFRVFMVQQWYDRVVRQSPDAERG